MRRQSSPTAVDARGVSLYLRLANTFRSKIQSGEWKPGEQLPTIPTLTEEYGVGTITVRQAFGMLAEEGLIESFRGRGTFVKSDLKLEPQHNYLRSVISNPMTDSPDLKIKVLKRSEVDALPPDLAERHAQSGPYVWVRKLHFYSNVPFAFMDIYVTREVYRRFPSNAEHKFTIPRLVSDYGEVSIATNELEMSIRFADDETARLLNYTPTGALAKLRRWRTDANDNIILGSINYFRADMFVLDVKETSQPFNINSIRPGSPAGR